MPDVISLELMDEFLKIKWLLGAEKILHSDKFV